MRYAQILKTFAKVRTDSEVLGWSYISDHPDNEWLLFINKPDITRYRDVETRANNDDSLIIQYFKTVEEARVFFLGFFYGIRA